MSNPYLTGSFNKYRNKIKGNNKTNYSISPNIKITQYLERKKNIIHHKSPTNLLNKSQNIRENQKISKINLKNYIINKKLNKKKISHNNKMKHHNRKSNSINPINSNFSIKLNSMNTLPGCFINNNTTYYINNNTNNNNNINNINNNNVNNINNINNKTISKNNSLSYYYTSNGHNMTNIHKSKNINKILNDQALQKIMCMKANMSYYSNFNYNKNIIHRIHKKNAATNLTTDNSNSRNLKTPNGNYFITEESKFLMKEKKKIKSKSKPKSSYIKTKKSKKKNSNNVLNKIKANNPLKIPHKNSYHRPQMTFLGDSVTDKNAYSPSIESIELKIAKNVQNIKNVDKEKKFEKLKNTCEEAIEYLVPVEYQKIFYLMLKEFDNINNLNLNDIKYLKGKKEELEKNIKIIENENNIYKMQLEQNNKEIASIKNKLKNTENNYMKFPFKKNKNIQSIKFKNFPKNIQNYDDEEEENNENLNTDSHYSEQISNKRNEDEKDNSYLVKLNKKNLNDLEAIYFFDKVRNNKASNNNHKNEGYNNNYKNNRGELVPQLNLDPEYIEDCKTKELLKIEGANLTPFQKIALQFEKS